MFSSIRVVGAQEEIGTWIGSRPDEKGPFNLACNARSPQSHPASQGSDDDPDRSWYISVSVTGKSETLPNQSSQLFFLNAGSGLGVPPGSHRQISQRYWRCEVQVTL
jgi:hypothetical protein